MRAGASVTQPLTTLGQNHTQNLQDARPLLSPGYTTSQNPGQAGSATPICRWWKTPASTKMHSRQYSGGIAIHNALHGE